MVQSSVYRLCRCLGYAALAEFWLALGGVGSWHCLHNCGAAPAPIWSTHKRVPTAPNLLHSIAAITVIALALGHRLTTKTNVHLHAGMEKRSAALNKDQATMGHFWPARRILGFSPASNPWNYADKCPMPPAPNKPFLILVGITQTSA